MLQILDRAASLATIIVDAMTMPGGRKWLLFLPISLLLLITTTSANELEIPQEFARYNRHRITFSLSTCNCQIVSHEQLGGVGGHESVLVQLPARGERVVRVQEREEARNSGLPGSTVLCKGCLSASVITLALSQRSVFLLFGFFICHSFFFFFFTLYVILEL